MEPKGGSGRRPEGPTTGCRSFLGNLRIPSCCRCPALGPPLPPAPLPGLSCPSAPSPWVGALPWACALGLPCVHPSPAPPCTLTPGSPAAASELPPSPWGCRGTGHTSPRLLLRACGGSFAFLPVWTACQPACSEHDPLSPRVPRGPHSSWGVISSPTSVATRWLHVPAPVPSRAQAA